MSDRAAIPAELIGLDLFPGRTAELVRLYGAIWPQIRKLRDFDLSAVHPAVVFDPRPSPPGDPA